MSQSQTNTPVPLALHTLKPLDGSKGKNRSRFYKRGQITVNSRLSACAENLHRFRRGPDQNIDAHDDEKVAEALLQLLLRHPPCDARPEKAACYAEPRNEQQGWLVEQQILLIKHVDVLVKTAVGLQRNDHQAGCDRPVYRDAAQ